MVFFVTVLFRLINRLTNRGMRLLAIILMIVYGAELLFVFFSFTTVPNTDSFYTNDLAASMAEGTSDIIDGTSGYFSNYSNNNGIVVLMYFIYSFTGFFGITDYVAVGRFFNVLCLMSAQLMFYFGFSIFFQSRKTAVKFMVVSLLYPPVVLFVPWIYTATMCLPFMAGVVLFGARLMRAKTKKSVVINSGLVGVITVAGYFLRPVVMILAIAFFVCLLLWTIRRKISLKRTAAIVLISAVCAGGTYGVLNTINNSYYTGSIKAFPMLHWVAMGLSDDGTYDNKLNVVNSNLKTTEEIQKNVEKYIDKALSNYDFCTFVEHLYIKHNVMWGDGTQKYQSRLNSLDEAPVFSPYFCGSQADFLYIYCQMFWIAMNILSIIYAVSFLFNKINKKSLVFPLAMLGAYGFYMIWEAKCGYSLPFIFLVSIMATLGGESLENNVTKLPSRITYLTGVTALVVALVFTFPEFTLKAHSGIDNYVSLGSTHTYVDNIAKENKVVRQSFYTDKSLNKVRVNIEEWDLIGAIKPVYHFKVYNYDNRLIAYTNLDTNKISVYNIINEQFFLDKNSRNGDKHPVSSYNYPVSIDFNSTYVPKGREKFTIEIVATGSDKDTIRLATSRGKAIDPIKGEMLVNGEFQPTEDLKFAAGYKSREPLTTPVGYIITYSVFVVLSLLLYVFYLRRKKSKDEVR